MSSSTGEAAYRAIVENFPNGLVALFDHELRYTVVGGDGHAALGMSSEDLEGKRLRDVFPRDVFERDEPMLRRTLAGEKTTSEVSFGDQHFRVITVPVRDAAGDVVTGLVMSQNVTPLVQAREDRAQIAEELSLAVDTDRLGIWSFDFATRRLHWNDRMFEIFGVDPAGFSGSMEVFRERLHPEDRPRVDADFAQIGERGSVDEVRFRIVRPDGEVRRILGSRALRRSIRGEVLGYVGINLDVTASWRDAERLRESEARYRRLFEGSYDAVVAVDRRGRICDSNAETQQLTGLPRERIEGRTLSALGLAAADDRGPGLDHLAELSLSDGRVAFVAKLAREDDSVRTVEVRARPTAGDELMPVVLRDVTARLEAEAERERFDQQLRQAQRLEALGRLTGGVAHDLNNLLQVIISQSQDVIRAGGQAGSLEAIADVLEAGKRAERLVAQLMAFGRRQLHGPTVVDLNQVVESSLQMLGTLIGELITVAWSPSPEPATVKAELGLVEQVVMNLALNARDAMASGGTLTISTAIAAAPATGRSVILEVADTGVGMSEEVTSRIFEPFFTTKGPGRGTGLGLSSVYGIVRQHGGEITVHSELGRGSRFRVAWPHTDEGLEAGDDAPSPADLGPLTLVLAEDDRLVRRSVVRSLTSEGHRVYPASDGHEAIALLERHHAEVSTVILDVVMPRMGGVETFQIIKERWAELPVVFMSGHNEADLTRFTQGDVPASILTKPFAREDLLRIVAETIRAARARR